MANNLLWHVVNAQTGERLSTYRGREDRFPDSFYAKYFAEEGIHLKLMPTPPGKHSVANLVPRFFNSRWWREYIIAAARALHKSNPKAEITPYDLPSDVIVLAAYVWYNRFNRTRNWCADFTALEAGEEPVVLPISPSAITSMKDSTWNKYYELIEDQAAARWAEINELIDRAMRSATAQSSGAQDS